MMKTMTGEQFPPSCVALSLNKATSRSDYALFMSESLPFLEEIPRRSKLTPEGLIDYLVPGILLS